MKQKSSEKKERLLMGSGRRIDGYFTVEAAMVLPVVIGTIVFIICLQLFLYDRCLMEQDVDMLAVQAVKEYQGNAEQTRAAVLEWKDQNLTDKYMGWRREDLTLSKRFGKLKLEQDGELITDYGLWKANVWSENRLLNAAYFLRGCRKIERIREEAM